MRPATHSPQKTLVERFNDWLQRRWWRYQYRMAHRNAFKIATMGYDNGRAQVFLDNAKDELYRAAREFKALERRSVGDGNEEHLAAPGKPKSGEVGGGEQESRDTGSEACS